MGCFEWVAIRKLTDLLEIEKAPSTECEFCGKTLKTNRYGDFCTQECYVAYMEQEAEESEENE